MNKLLIILSAVLLAASSVCAKVVTDEATGLSWEAPVTNEDGSELTDLAGFRVYQDGELVADVHDTQFLWVELPVSHGETTEFFVTAYDAAGNESLPSETLQVTADFVAPGKPMSMSVQVTVTVQSDKGTK